MIKVEVIKSFCIAQSNKNKKSYIYLDEDRANELMAKGFIVKVKEEKEKATKPKKKVEKR